MPSPSAALATQRPDLASSFEEFSLEANREGFIGTDVLTVINVAKQAGTFGIIPVEQLLQHPETLRAPGSNYNRMRWKFETSTYATEEHGIEEPVDDRESAMYMDYFDAEVMASRRAFHAVLVAQEIRIATAVFNATTWTGAALTTAITNEWDDATNATPFADVEAAVQAVYEGTGLWPNALIMNYKVFRNLRLTAQVVDRVKYQGFVDARPGNITAEALGQAFDLRIIIAGGTKNTAKEGQAASTASIWDDEYAMVARVATSEDPREPCIGRVFHWAEDGSSIGGTVESYRDEQVRGDVVRVRHDVDELIIYPGAGHLLSNVTTIP
jgi:hypothetical protein